MITSHLSTLISHLPSLFPLLSSPYFQFFPPLILSSPLCSSFLINFFFYSLSLFYFSPGPLCPRCFHFLSSFSIILFLFFPSQSSTVHTPHYLQMIFSPSYYTSSLPPRALYMNHVLFLLSLSYILYIPHPIFLWNFFLRGYHNGHHLSDLVLFHKSLFYFFAKVAWLLFLFIK